MTGHVFRLQQHVGCRPTCLPADDPAIERLGGGNPLAIASSMNVGSHLVDFSPLSTNRRSLPCLGARVAARSSTSFLYGAFDVRGRSPRQLLLLPLSFTSMELRRCSCMYSQNACAARATEEHGQWPRDEEVVEAGGPGCSARRWQFFRRMRARSQAGSIFSSLGRSSPEASRTRSLSGPSFTSSSKDAAKHDRLDADSATGRRRTQLRSSKDAPVEPEVCRAADARLHGLAPHQKPFPQAARRFRHAVVRRPVRELPFMAPIINRAPDGD